ncbi:MAG: PilZ domain-containing protein [Acidobacteriota bacterium]
MPRKDDRTNILLEITLECASGTRTARISDLSIGGCFVDTFMQVHVGERVQIKLQLTEGQWEEMAGEVTYILPNFGFGLNFTEISEEQKTHIASVIAASGRAA